MTRIEAIKQRVAAAERGEWEQKFHLAREGWSSKGYGPVTAPQDLRDLLLCYDALRAIVKSQWEHRCPDGVGGCTAVSGGELYEASAVLSTLDSPVGDEGAK